jgi:hypothetical protein
MDVINKYSDFMKAENDIILRGYGLYYAGQDKIYDGKIHVIDLGYSVDKRMKYDEARDLFYYVVDGLLNKLNGDPSLKDYFYHYPVGYEDLFFRLSFDYEKKGYLKKDDLSMIYIFENKIGYCILSEEGPAQMKQRELGSDVYILEGFSPKEKVIKRKLPEQ